MKYILIILWNIKRKIFVELSQKNITFVFSNQIFNTKTMATPIKITPVLKGKDSVYFHKQLAKTSRKKIAPKDKKRIFSLVDRVMANSNMEKH